MPQEPGKTRFRLQSVSTVKKGLEGQRIGSNIALPWYGSQSSWGAPDDELAAHAREPKPQLCKLGKLYEDLNRPDMVNQSFDHFSQNCYMTIASGAASTQNRYDRTYFVFEITELSSAKS